MRWLGLVLRINAPVSFYRTADPEELLAAKKLPAISMICIDSRIELEEFKKGR
jgi:hypothetical protein